MANFKYDDVPKHLYMESLVKLIEEGKKIKTDLGEVVLDNRGKSYTGFKKLVESGKKADAVSYLKSTPDAFIVKDTMTNLLLTKIDKSPFSKSGGSGAGAAQTAMAECAVCIMTASLVHLDRVDLSESGIKKISSVLDLGKQSTITEIKKIVDWLAMNPDWYETSHKSAEEIIKQKNITKQHHFHRDSVFMNSIYKQFQDNLKPINKLNLRVSGDKWNPGDIWISNKTKFPAHNDITTLNQTILKGFSEDDIIGISLKKLGSSIRWDVYNLPKSKKHFVFKKIVKPKSLMSSKDMYIETESGMVIQIRSFNAGDNIQCELKGAFANGGKCGFGATNYIIKNITGTEIIPNTKIKKMTENEIIEHINKNYNDMGISSTVKKLQDEFSKKSFKNAAVQKDFLLSKLQSTQIACLVKNSPQRNVIVTGLFGYAHSLGLEGLFEASVYAKIH